MNFKSTIFSLITFFSSCFAPIKIDSPSCCQGLSLSDFLKDPYEFIPKPIKDAAIKMNTRAKRWQLGWKNTHPNWIKEIFGEESTEKTFLDIQPTVRTKNILPYWTAAEVEESFSEIAKKSNAPHDQIVLVSGLDMKKLHESYFGQNQFSALDESNPDLVEYHHFAVLQLANKFNLLDGTTGPTQSSEACIEAVLTSLLRETLINREADRLPHILGNILPKKIFDEAELKPLLNQIEANIQNIIVIPSAVINERSLSEQIHFPCAVPCFQIRRASLGFDSDAKQICKTLLVTQYKLLAMTSVILSEVTNKTTNCHITAINTDSSCNPCDLMQQCVNVMLEIIKDRNVRLFVHLCQPEDVNLFQEILTSKQYKLIDGDSFLKLKSEEDLKNYNIEDFTKTTDSPISSSLATTVEPLDSFEHQEQATSLTEPITRPEDKKEILNVSEIFNELNQIVYTDLFKNIFDGLRTPAYSNEIHSRFIQRKTNPYILDLLAAIFLICKDLNLYQNVKELSHFYDEYPDGTQRQNHRAYHHHEDLLIYLSKAIFVIKERLKDTEIKHVVLQNTKYVDNARELVHSFKQSEFKKIEEQNSFVNNRVNKFQHNTAFAIDAAAELVAIASYIEREVLKNFEANPWNQFYNNGKQDIILIEEKLNDILEEFEELIASPKIDPAILDAINDYTPGNIIVEYKKQFVSRR